MGQRVNLSSELK